MRRIRELIADVRKRYPNDDFFSSFERKCRAYPMIGKTARAYNRALMVMDDQSWQILKSKALQHYCDHRPGQKKQGFFNQLNESFAYRYLVSQGFTDVRFIKEIKTRSPDISFMVDNTQAYCEVKTLGISQDEIDRRSTKTCYDPRVYASLNESFFKKFCDAVNRARQQIHAFGPNGLVFLIVLFDDAIRLDWYDNYRKQLLAFSRTHDFDNLFIKVGVSGNRGIAITSGSSISPKRSLPVNLDCQTKNIGRQKP